MLAGCLRDWFEGRQQVGQGAVQPGAIHRPDLIVQIVHCGPRHLPSGTGSVVRPPHAPVAADTIPSWRRLPSTRSTRHYGPFPVSMKSGFRGRRYSSDVQETIHTRSCHSPCDTAMRIGSTPTDSSRWWSRSSSSSTIRTASSRSITRAASRTVSDGDHQVSCSLRSCTDNTERSRTAPTGAAGSPSGGVAAITHSDRLAEVEPEPLLLDKANATMDDPAANLTPRGTAVGTGAPAPALAWGVPARTSST